MLKRKRSQRVSAVLCPLFGLFLTFHSAAQDWLQELERFKQEDKLEEALGFLEDLEAQIPDSAQRLAYLREKSILERRLGFFDASLETTVRLQVLARAMGRPIEAAQALLFEGSIHRQQGRLKEAGNILEEAVFEARSTANQKLLAQALIDQALVLASLGSYGQAQRGFDESRSLEIAVTDPELNYRLESGQAVLHAYQGHPERSLDHYRKALQVARRDLPEQLPVALTNLAQSHLQMQRYAQALQGFQEVLEMSQDPNIATLTSLGICQYELNRFEDAILVFERARLKAQEIGNRRLEAWALGEKGLAVERGRRDTPLAEKLLRESVAGFRMAGDLRNALVMEENLGAIWRDAGQWERALSQFRRVEREYRRLAGQQMPANLFKSMGECLLELGRHSEAERMFARTRVEAERSGDSKRIWQTAQLMARLVEETGRSEMAEAYYEESLAMIESARGALRLDSFKTDFFEDKVRVYEDYIHYLVRKNEPDMARRTLELAERGKARSFLDTLAESESKLDQTLSPEILEEESRRLNTISEIQAELRKNGSDSGTSDRLKAAESSLQSLYLRIRREVPEFAEFRYPAPASLDQIQGTLRENEFILEFFLGKQSSYRWLIGKDKIQMREFDSAPEIEKQVRSALNLFLDAQRDPENLGGISRALLGDLDEIKDGSSLILIPSGILHYFPFEVLALVEGSSWLWKVDTSYLPSASSLRFLRDRSASRRTTPRLLAMGDPIFSSPTKQASPDKSFGGLDNFGQLPYSRNEVNQVKSIFGLSQSLGLVGSQAQESLFKSQQLADYSIIHLATHGWIDPRYPSRSGVIFGPDSGSEDGILQVREIFGLRLNADLVTLSACQTGLGRLVTGEGMIGLNRAFFYAGTDTILATLWNINDRATSLFMKHFYSALRDGASTAGAARQARLAMFQDGRHAHPVYWAPFVVQGLGSGGIVFPPRQSSPVWIWWASFGLLGALIGFALLTRLPQFSRGDS